MQYETAKMNLGNINLLGSGEGEGRCKENAEESWQQRGRDGGTWGGTGGAAEKGSDFGFIWGTFADKVYSSPKFIL